MKMKMSSSKSEIQKTNKSYFLLKKPDKVIPALLFFFILAGHFFDTGQKISCAYSQEDFQFSRRDKVFGIHFIDERCGWVVGDKGLLLKTVDGGGNWQRVKVPGGTLNDIVFVGQKGWIVGGGGMILHSDDGGKGWRWQMGSGRKRSAGAERAEGEVCSGVEGSFRSLMKVFFMDTDRGLQSVLTGRF